MVTLFNIFMCNQFLILFLLSFFLSLAIFQFTSVSSATNDDDGFFSVVPEDYYNFEDYHGAESKVSNQLDQENNTSDQNPSLTTSPLPTTTKTVKKHSFNIAVTADWGCEEDTKKNSKEYSK